MGFADPGGGSSPEVVLRALFWVTNNHFSETAQLLAGQADNVVFDESTATQLLKVPGTISEPDDGLLPPLFIPPRGTIPVRCQFMVPAHKTDDDEWLRPKRVDAMVSLIDRFGVLHLASPSTWVG